MNFRNLFIILVAVFSIACAETTPEPVTGHQPMYLPNGHAGYSVWCRGGQARCWWEAQRICGTAGYKTFGVADNSWTQTDVQRDPAGRGYHLDQRRSRFGEVLIECGPFDVHTRPPVPNPGPSTDIERQSPW